MNVKAGKTEKYYLYRRQIKETRSGKPVKAWYYWFYDNEGKQVRKSCGTAKEPVLSQGEAERRIAEIEAEDARREAAMAQEYAKAHEVRIKDLAGGMYLEGSKHMVRRVQRGDGLSKTTLTECRGYLTNWIIPRFGDRRPQDIDVNEIVEALIDTDRSGAWKNRCIEVFTEVFHDAK